MEIGLGLDLKGGMNVTLQISVADVLKSLSNNNPDPNFNAAIAAAQAAQAGNNDFIVSFYNEYKKIDPNVRLSAIFSTFQLKDKITPRSTNDEVISILREELNSALDNSYNVLRTRIDRPAENEVARKNIAGDFACQHGIHRCRIVLIDNTDNRRSSVTLCIIHQRKQRILFTDTLHSFGFRCLLL